MANGGVLYCAQGAGLFTPPVKNTCFNSPQTIKLEDTVRVMTELDQRGVIDSLKGLSNTPLYFFHTLNDSLITPQATYINERLFRQLGAKDI